MLESCVQDGVEICSEDDSLFKEANSIDELEKAKKETESTYTCVKNYT